MPMTYNVTVIATDGDHRTEGEFADIADAWEYISDMGSRWFFYPIHVVSNNGVVVEAAPEFTYLEGMDVRDLPSVANEMQETCELFS